MSRFFVPKESVNGGLIHVSGEEAHHILDVMRLKVSDKVAAFDGTGREYLGFIKSAGRKDLIIEVVKTRISSDQDSLRITLIQAIPKKEKMDYIIEKASELGAYSILPVSTERTIVRWDEPKARSNVERWRKIAREASKQCGRSTVPVIGDVKEFDSVMRGPETYDLAIIAALGADAITLKNAIAGFAGTSVGIAIGPEGDFTPQEVENARARGFRMITLGRRVLKSDTAGLAALAILNHEITG